MWQNQANKYTNAGIQTFPLNTHKRISQHLKLVFLSFQENLPRKSKQKTTFFSQATSTGICQIETSTRGLIIFFIYNSPFVSFPDTAVLFRYPAFTGQINIV